MFTLWMEKNLWLAIYVFVKPDIKLAMPATETNCWWRSYCQPSEASPRSLHLYSRSVHRLIMHVKHWSCFVVRLPSLLFLTCGHSTSRTLFQVITTFREWCHYRIWQSCGIGRWACDEAIDQWRKSHIVCSWTRSFSSYSDIACCLLHDCIKHIESVTFLISSYLL